MSAAINQLLDDAKLAIETIGTTSHTARALASAEWLESIARQIREELAKKTEVAP